MNIETINNLLKKALDEKDDSKLRIRVEIIHETIATLSKPLQEPLNPEMIQHSSFNLKAHTEALTSPQGYIQGSEATQPAQIPPQITPQITQNTPQIPPTAPPADPSDRAKAFAQLNLPPQPKRKAKKQRNEVSRTESKGNPGGLPAL